MHFHGHQSEISTKSTWLNKIIMNVSYVNGAYKVFNEWISAEFLNCKILCRRAFFSLSNRKTFFNIRKKKKKNKRQLQLNYNKHQRGGVFESWKFQHRMWKTIRKKLGIPFENLYFFFKWWQIERWIFFVLDIY